mmetsp:Transcript_9901/g.16223  ORF Transcript_9901/g.16223 Transcript_9901/m.16223 type:complete len:246 (+) Transcript_9901:1016-1753(+)
MQCKLLGEVLRKTKCTRHSWNDSHLQKRITVLEIPPYDCMPSFVICNCSQLFLCHHRVLLLKSTDDPVNSALKAVHGNLGLIFPRSQNRSLITDVRNLGPRKPWCKRSHTLGNLLFASIHVKLLEMDLKDLLASLDIWKINLDLPIKSTWAQNRLIQDINTIGTCKNDNTFFCRKPIHFNQKLIQGILTLIVSTTESTFSTCSCDSINLVNEHNTRRILSSLSKQISNSGRTHTDKHLDKIRPRD